MRLRKMRTRWRSALPAGFLRPAVLFTTAVSMSGLVMTPIAVLAAVIGVWRFGSAPGWTNDSFLATGLLSRYQLWFAVAIGAETSGFFLNRWVANRTLDAHAARKSYTMTHAELAHLQSVLEARQSGLERLLRNREEIAVESSADLLDQLQHASEREMAVGNLERESERLREVRAALRRVHAGTFGTCVDCEAEISQKRLAAVPWTASCLVCQEAADRILPRNGYDEPRLADD